MMRPVAVVSHVIASLRFHGANSHRWQDLHRQHRFSPDAFLNNNSTVPSFAHFDQPTTKSFCGSCMQKPTSTIETKYGVASLVPISTFVDSVLPPLPPQINFEPFVESIREIRCHKKRIVTKEDRLSGYGRRDTYSLRPRPNAIEPLRTCGRRLGKKANAF